VLLALSLIAVSNAFYTYGESLTAAFLPELARDAILATRVAASGQAGHGSDGACGTNPASVCEGLNPVRYRESSPHR
jgi:hypothetical protein